MTCFTLAKMKNKNCFEAFFNYFLTFKFSLIWTYILWCLLDFKSFDTLSTFFLRLEFADHSNDLALVYSARFMKTSMFLCQKYKHLFYDYYYYDYS